MPESDSLLGARACLLLLRPRVLPELGADLTLSLKRSCAPAACYADACLGECAGLLESRSGVRYRVIHAGLPSQRVAGRARFTSIKHAVSCVNGRS